MGLSIELGVLWAHMPLSLYLIGAVAVRISSAFRRRCFTQAKSVWCEHLGRGVCEICAEVSIHLTGDNQGCLTLLTRQLLDVHCTG